jgi:ribonuclease R
MYVEIDPTKIEGMVPLRDIKSDFFEFDEDNYCLRGRRTRKVYRLGDPVRIRVKATNLEQRLLDYELIESEIENAPAPDSRKKRSSDKRSSDKRSSTKKPAKTSKPSKTRKSR